MPIRSPYDVVSLMFDRLFNLYHLDVENPSSGVWSGLARKISQSSAGTMVSAKYSIASHLALCLMKVTSKPPYSLH
jgi:hypothetical protein